MIDGHARQVRHVDLDDAGEPVLRRVFFEVDRGRHADRQRHQRRHEHHQRGADGSGQDAGVGRLARRERGEEAPAEPRRAVAHQVEEQDRKDCEAREQDREADEDEDLVELLAPGETAADLLQRHVRGGGHQYASRKRRVRKKPITLRTSVISISTRPAAKMLW